MLATTQGASAAMPTPPEEDLDTPDASVTQDLADDVAPISSASCPPRHEQEGRIKGDIPQNVLHGDEWARTTFVIIVDDSCR